MAIEVFGAGAVQSAYVSYLPLNITANDITLLWPTSYVNAPYIDPISGIHYSILAASMNVSTNAGNANEVILPDATKSSVGSNFIIKNVGAGEFDLSTSDEVTLISIAPGLSYWIQLTDNSTLDGTWSVVQFGAGNSEASSHLLAGNGVNGIVAIGPTLQSDTTIALENVPPALDESFRAQLIVWRGGPDTLTLPAIGSVSEGYYVSFNNAGSAQISIQPGEAVTTIDRELSVTVQVQQSLTIISDGTNWWTLGFGQNQFAATTVINKDVSGAGNVTLTSIESASLIQNYHGALGANITVFFPTANNYWFVSNLTTNAFTLSVQLVGPLGTSYVVPQGTKQIFYSNGTSLFRIPTALTLDDPLSIASGGTGATAQSAAATAILPPAVDGDILYFNGGVWNVLPKDPVDGKVLTLVAGLPAWV